MAIVWLRYGDSMAILWLFYDYSMAILWLFYSYSMAILWLFYGYSMATLARYELDDITKRICSILLHSMAILCVLFHSILFLSLKYIK